MNSAQRSIIATAIGVCAVVMSATGSGRGGAAHPLIPASPDSVYATVGSRLISGEDVFFVNHIRILNPALFFPELSGVNIDPTRSVEIELLYQVAASRSAFVDSIRKTRTWKLLETHWRGAAYSTQFLLNTYGFSIARLEKFFADNTARYRRPVSDSSGRIDSLVVPFTAVQGRVARDLYLASNPVDHAALDAFMRADPARFNRKGIKDIDSAMVAEYWEMYVEREYESLFLHRFLREWYGGAAEDTLARALAAKSIVTSGDIDCIVSLFPAAQRAVVNEPANRIQLHRKMIIEAVFSEKARQEKDPAFKRIMEGFVDWGFRYEVGRVWMLRQLAAWQASVPPSDSIECLVPFWHVAGKVDTSISPYAMEFCLNARNRDTDALFLGRYIYDAMQKFPVNANQTYLKNPYSAGSAAFLLAQADSLGSHSANIEEIRAAYEQVIRLYYFTPQSAQASFALSAFLQRHNKPGTATMVLQNLFIHSVDKPAVRCRAMLELGNLYTGAMQFPALARKCHEWVAARCRADGSTAAPDRN